VNSCDRRKGPDAFLLRDAFVLTSIAAIDA
jgi:hypothetical protein